MISTSSQAPGTSPLAAKGQKNQPTSGRANDRFAALRALEVKFIDNPAFATGNAQPAKEVGPFVEQVELGRASVPALNTSLPAHLARLCETPLLTANQERELFRRMNFHKARAATLIKGLRKSVKKADAIDDHLARAERIRNYIVQANTRLVMSIARGFADARNAFDDLLSHGVASLLHATEKFDFDRGYRFSTYATCAVRRDLYRMVMGTKKDAQRFSTGADEMLSGCADYRSESAGISESSWQSLSNSIRQMMEQLDDREQLIMAARFGFGDEQGKASYSHLGERLGISKERVRQLANRALDKLREMAPEHRLEAVVA